MGANTGSQKAQLSSQDASQAAAQNSQNQLLQQNSAAFSPYLSGNVGFTPQQLSALTSSVLNQNSQKYNSATQQTNEELAARGENGQTPLSGAVGATGYGNLQAAKASDYAGGLNQIVQNNATQALANKFNAGSILSGNAQTYAGNVGTYGSGASNALSSLTTAQQGGFLNNFTKSFAGGLGSGVGAGVVGGLGTAASKIGSGNFGW